VGEGIGEWGGFANSIFPQLTLILHPQQASTGVQVCTGFVQASEALNIQASFWFLNMPAF
jgi:hypothetical protein